jgi:hypothetical protein
MSFYRVVPIDPHIAARVRGEMKSPQYGHPAHAEPARGYGPCRSCLTTFRISEEDRILFTYNPFDGLTSYPSPGPVFIHRDECTAFEGDGFPPELRALPLVVEGYGAGRKLLHQEFVGEDDVETVIGRVLTDTRVDYAHLRNAEAGCFIAQIERAG